MDVRSEPIIPRITRLELMKAAKKQWRNNPAFEKLYENKGFEKGEGDLSQLIKDIEKGSIHYNNTKAVREPSWGTANPQLSYLTTIENEFGTAFGDKNNVNNPFISAYSQHSSYIVFNIIMFAYQNYGVDPKICQPKNRICNIYKDNNDIFMECILDNFPIGDPIDGVSKIIGSIPGPVRSVFKLVQKDGVWGYELQYIETQNEDIKNILLGKKPMPAKDLISKYGMPAVTSVISSATVAAAAANPDSSAPSSPTLAAAVAAASSESSTAALFISKSLDDLARLFDEIRKTNTQNRDFDMFTAKNKIVDIVKSIANETFTTDEILDNLTAALPNQSSFYTKENFDLLYELSLQTEAGKSTYSSMTLLSSITSKYAFKENKSYADAKINLQLASLISNDKNIKKAAENVITSAENTIKMHPNKAKEVTDTLLLAAHVVYQPSNKTHIDNLATQGNKLRKPSWGKMLGGATLALAGVALVAGFTATALVTFGALAPVSVLGFVLGTSMVAGGLAVLGAGVGGAYLGVGSSLFHQGIKRSDKLGDSAIKLANVAKK